MMPSSYINLLFRGLQLIPLILVLLPIFKSYWQKRNHINGLRKIRVALIILISSIIFSNIYFMMFSYLSFPRNSTIGLIYLTADKLVSLSAYLVLYWLFKHSSSHAKDLDQEIVGLKQDVKDGKNV